jgi:hypothetical protein
MAGADFQPGQTECESKKEEKAAQQYRENETPLAVSKVQSDRLAMVVPGVATHGAYLLSMRGSISIAPDTHT